MINKVNLGWWKQGCMSEWMMDVRTVCLVFKFGEPYKRSVSSCVKEGVAPVCKQNVSSNNYGCVKDLG